MSNEHQCLKAKSGLLPNLSARKWVLSHERCRVFLLPNWFAGSAGILGFGILYLGRIGQEERLMLDTFGDDYRIYMNRTARIVPWIH